MQNFSCENEFYLHEINNPFNVNSVAPSLALKQRFGSTRKWNIRIINVLLTRQNHNYFY